MVSRSSVGTKGITNTESRLNEINTDKRAAETNDLASMPDDLVISSP